MGHTSAINRLKRPQEGPKSGCESGPGATLRHTYDLIDSKTLQGAKNDPMRVDKMRLSRGMSVYFVEASYRI